MSRLHAHIGTIRQLEIFLAVFETGSVSGAAKTLHLTQPTVSMQLKKLSDAVGLPLYQQSGHTLVFSEAGLELAKSAQEVLHAFEKLETNLSNLKGIKAGTLRLGVVSTAKYFIPHLLADFCKEYPEIDIELNIGNRSQIIERLWTGRDDFCVFSHPPDNDALTLTEFLPNPLVAIAPINHHLAQQKKVTLQAFSQEPFIMRESGSGTRYAIEQKMKSLGVNLNIKMTIESNEAVKHFVMSGLGVSILSQHTLALGGASGLKILNIPNFPITTNWYLSRLHSLKPSLLARVFLEYIETKGRKKVLALLT